MLTGTAGAQTQLIGWATLNGGTTGGAGGETVIVTTRNELYNALNSTGPKIIRVSGMISLLGESITGSQGDKTVEGVDSNSGWYGCVKISGPDAHNIIIRNLTLQTDNLDPLIIQAGATNVWVDHCSFVHGIDELISFKDGADYITISWCKFSFDIEGDHNLAALVGSTDNHPVDEGHLNITWHHNWFADRVHGRMPRVRYGKNHVINNYYAVPDHDGYCITANWDSQVLVENNYFYRVESPWNVADLSTGHPGKLRAVGNLLVECFGSISSGNDTVFTPPYYYTLEAPLVAREKVMLCAGAGHLDCFADDMTPPTPDPMTWAVEPYTLGPSSVQMTATTAQDYTGVEYYFYNVTDPSHNSGWQLEPTYLDEGLTPSTTYTYRVQARDASPNLNVTALSAAASTMTGPPDTVAPTPNPMTWSSTPAVFGNSSIAMTATTASDSSGVEYYFANLTDPTHDSGWQAGQTYVDTDLLQNTEYTYTVTARDLSSNHNETAPSAAASETISTAAPIFVNFQPSGSTIPTGYNPDYGDLYGSLGSGLTYGWNISHTDNPRERNINSDQRLDTIMHFHVGGAWEIAAPAGEYAVEVTIGDPAFASVYTINVEGVSYWNALSLGINQFRTLTKTVQVSDGRITMNQGSGAEKATRICYVHVTPLSLDDVVSPDPDPMTWYSAPQPVTSSSITMTASAASDPSGVEYYFENMTDPTHSSGWQSSATFIDIGLELDTSYSYRVKARDLSDNHNETGWSDPLSAITLPYDCSDPLNADLNDDCQVNFVDHAIFADAWATGEAEADLDGSGLVNWNDVLEFVADWLTCNRAPSSGCWQ